MPTIVPGPITTPALVKRVPWGWMPATKQDLANMEHRISLLILSGNSQKLARFNWAVAPVSPKALQQHTMEIKITNEQMVRVTLTPKTDTGKPAKLDGKPTWEVIDGDSTIDVAEDGLSANLISADLPGDTQIMVKADADIGEGVEEISEVIKLTVIGATAKNLGIVAEAAQPKP